MALRHWSTRQLLEWLALVCVAGWWPITARAQWADVPRSDVNGDFQTTKVQGNRGYYQQKFWLIVDRDPQGLNCRPMNGGEPLVKLDYGGILMTNVKTTESNAISFRKKMPWLNVTLNRLSSPRLDLRRGAERSGPYHCQVRANADLIAPINLSAIEELRHIKDD